MIRFHDLAPEFAEELAALLIAEDEPGLAEQILSAEIVARCRCEDELCASFYTAPPPADKYGPGYDGLQLGPITWGGGVHLDVEDGRLMHVEVLYNPEFRRRLRRVLP
jgi:hypothetical protein